MKFGVNLINFGPSATPEMLIRWVRIAEGLGYNSILTSDHVAITKDVATKYPAPFYEPISTLGWLAGVTTKLEIGTTVMIVPYRNPLETARALTNIDNLSGGRLIFGVGIGWAEEEFGALNLPYRERGAMTNEYLTAIRQFWTQDKVDFEGKYFSYEGVSTAPRPVRKPHPPIWVGGASDAALRRTVRLGDAWHPIRFQENWFRDKGIPRLREIADEEGASMPALCPRVRLRILDNAADEGERIVGTGSLHQIHGDLAALEELGCEHVVLDTYYDDIEASKDVEAAWRTLAQVAETMIDLSSGCVR
ncbi:MAG: LLM class F420-dependent oxidoreductase [Pseudomonadota bacterium]|nr:LLM class F420-dependent oxidoreductase [Pseudomonadota bacterium]